MTAPVSRRLLPFAASTRAVVSSAVLTLVIALMLAIVGLALWPGQSLAAAQPDLDVRAAALIDADTGQQLYGLRSQAQLPIASTTKLMTALVTLEHARLSEVFANPPFYLAAQDSQIGLVPGERMSVHDLLIAMLLPSADDAAEDLAFNVGRGSVARFVAMMNAQASALGLEHTHYTTPIGLDTPGNYSSASDLVTLARYLLRTQPFFRRVVDMPTAVLRTGSHVREVTNLDDLVARVPWVIGVKTGHTLDAGYVLVSAGRRDGMTLIGAVLGAPSESARDASALSLLDWGYENFALRTLVKAGQVLARRPVSGRPGLHVDLIAAGTFTDVLARSTPAQTVVQAPLELAGPRPARQVVGAVVVGAGGVQLARIPLLLARAVPAAPKSLSAELIAGPFTLVVLVLLVGSGILLLRRRRSGPPRGGRPTA